MGNISSTIITKGEDPHRLGIWTTVTLLGNHNKRTSVFNMYRPGDRRIEKTGLSTVIKQHWVILQQKKQNKHPFSWCSNKRLDHWSKYKTKRHSWDHCHHGWQRIICKRKIVNSKAVQSIPTLWPTNLPPWPSNPH